jgi:hypothetical protein
MSLFTMSAGKTGQSQAKLASHVGAVRAHPFEAAEDSGQRPQESADAVGDHLAAQTIEAFEVAIRIIDDEFADLRARVRDRPFDQSLAAQF